MQGISVRPVSPLTPSSTSRAVDLAEGLISRWPQESKGQ